MKCPSCGADIPTAAAQCSYCGSQLPATAAGGSTHVFAKLRASAEFAARNSPQRLARLPKLNPLHKTFLILFFVVFIGISGVMCVAAVGMAGLFGVFGARAGGGLGAVMAVVPLLMAAVPLGFIALGIFLWRQAQKKMHAIENDPTEALPVVVIDKRTEVSGGSGNSSARTAYFVTCEDEGGDRREYQVWDGKLYGRMAAEDAGILFVRAGYGIDFDRVAV